MFGGGDEHEVWIARAQNEAVRIDVLSPVGAAPALPTTSAIQGDIKACSARDKDFLRIARVDERFVNVIEMLRGAVFIAEETHGIDLDPALS